MNGSQDLYWTDGRTDARTDGRTDARELIGPNRSAGDQKKCNEEEIGEKSKAGVPGRNFATWRGSENEEEMGIAYKYLSGKYLASLSASS